MALVQPDVPYPAGLVRESLAARRALVRLLTGVQETVRPDRRQVQKPLVAHLADVALVPFMDRREVALEGRDVRERPVALLNNSRALVLSTADA